MTDSIPNPPVAIDQDKTEFSEAKSLRPDVTHDKAVLTTAENGDDSVRRLLSNYDIGPKLRQLRLRKKIALVDLGKHTGLSASMLSQLENGKLVPTLPTLARIAMVFDVGLDHFFSDHRARRTFSIVRAAERLSFPELPDSPVPGFFFEVLAFGAMDKNMSAYLAEFPLRDGKPTRPHEHEGAEFIHVLQGVLTLNYQAEDHVLRAGDSVYFDASEAHSYRGASDEKARAVVVTSPFRT